MVYLDTLIIVEYFTNWNILSLIDILGCVAQELLCVFVMCIYIIVVSGLLLLPCLYALFIFLSTSSMMLMYTESEDGTRKLTYTPMLLTVY